MGPLLLIAIAAAAASALLAAGVAAGSMLAVPLFYLAPLPVMIAGIAFSPIAAALAVVFAGIGLGLMFGGTFLLAYAVGMGAPAFALAYAALLARPEPAGRDGVAWFPVGGLVLIAAAFATVGVWVAVLSMATDYDAYKAAITLAVEAMVTPGPAGLGHDPAAIGAFMAHVLPPMAGLITMVSQLICLYLAGRAALISQRLARPWPQLSALRLPRIAGYALAGGLLITLLPGMAGLAGSVAAATVLFAFALTGFAVVHAITLGHGARFLVLAGLWVTTLVLGWPVVAMAVLGFADSLFDFRSRFASGLGPPAANDR
ncbi:DUF2232 domain-containing protein [Xanthobacter sp. V4C-4]|uniref:DUF2232 domain-containing protein n=1 Tax=Xanthobacter cornucopiae TaxID=3119924 RepID=UPI0037279D55